MTSQEIRLLDLKHGREGEVIHCDLSTYKLSDAPEYIALSYTWGNAEDITSILCDGRIMNVTKNLKEALWQLRESRKLVFKRTFTDKSLSKLRYFWIDAVCINQSDDKEKSCQVQRMADIYKLARKAIVWLGPECDNSGSVLDYLNEFGAKAEACYIHIDPDTCREVWQEMVLPSLGNRRFKGSHVPIKHTNSNIVEIRREELESLFHSISGWHDQRNLLPVADMKKFLTRPWWGRIWVLQEVTVTKNVDFLCGVKSITQTRLSAAINAYSAFWHTLMSKSITDHSSLTRYQLEIIINGSHYRPNLMISSWRIHREGGFPLAAWLRATCVGSIDFDRHGPHHLEATDPRDKVFALLGLATDRKKLQDLGVSPDYTKSMEQIYTTIMKALLQQGHLSLLSLCQTPRSPSLPSWVPDWSKSITHMLQDVENDHVTVYPRFNACGPRKISKDDSIQNEGARVRMKVLAFVYDEISEMGKFPNRASSRKVPLAETFSWPTQWLLEIVHLTYRNKQSNQNFGSRLEAAARTSIGGVGWGQGSRLIRVGNERYGDAIAILHKGFTNIKDRCIRSEAQHFLHNNAFRYPRNNKNVLQSKLEGEIMGKSLCRLPFLTAKGHIGLGSEHFQCGDVITLINGAQVPFVLRRQSHGVYQLIGEAYIDGIMDGEAMQGSKFTPIELV